MRSILAQERNYLDEVEKLLKVKASKAGADAVYILSKSEKQEGEMIGYLAAMDTRLIVTGVVIKYKTVY